LWEGNIGRDHRYRYRCRYRCRYRSRYMYREGREFTVGAGSGAVESIFVRERHMKLVAGSRAGSKTCTIAWIVR
jgi:hypothetical protein